MLHLLHWVNPAPFLLLSFSEEMQSLSDVRWKSNRGFSQVYPSTRHKWPQAQPALLWAAPDANGPGRGAALPWGFKGYVRGWVGWQGPAQPPPSHPSCPPCPLWALLLQLSQAQLPWEIPIPPYCNIRQKCFTHRALRSWHRLPRELQVPWRYPGLGCMGPWAVWAGVAHGTAWNWAISQVPSSPTWLPPISLG